MIVVFDLETTGVNVKRDRIVQLAALKVDDSFVEQARLVMTVNPGIPIPKGASNVHGICDKDVLDKPKFMDVADEVTEFFAGCDLAGYNVTTFDIPLLNEELRRAGRASLEVRRVYDAFSVFKKFEGGGPRGKTLTKAYKFYCGEDLEGAHDAFVDTAASAAVLEAQIGKYQNHEKYPLTCVGDIHRVLCGNNVDLAGCFQWNDSGEVAITIGKYSGWPLSELVKRKRHYLQWMLDNDFASETKKIVRDALSGNVPSKEPPEPVGEKIDSAPNVCDVCSGEHKLRSGDECACGDGTATGLVRALRARILEMQRDRELRDSVERTKDSLLKDINEWMARMGFEGQGLVLQQRIKRVYWPDEE